VSHQRPFWRRWLLPACLALLGLNLAGAVAWTVPRGLRQRNAGARLEAARAEARRQRPATLALRERAAAIRANTSDVERFYARFAGSERADLIPTLEAVETMARSPGLKPGARTFSREPVKGTPLERVAITLPLAGSYDQLVGFLREVERSPRFLTVDGVSLRGEQGSARLQVELSTYLKLAPGELAARSGRVR
jgi:Tfp pilus assembly protein PilO